MQVCGVQALSGTGAIRMGLTFLFQNYPSKTLYLSKPTWGELQSALYEALFSEPAEPDFYFTVY